MVTMFGQGFDSPRLHDFLENESPAQCGIFYLSIKLFIFIFIFYLCQNYSPAMIMAFKNDIET